MASTFPRTIAEIDRTLAATERADRTRAWRGDLLSFARVYGVRMVLQGERDRGLPNTFPDKFYAPRLARQYFVR